MNQQTEADLDIARIREQAASGRGIGAEEFNHLIEDARAGRMSLRTRMPDHIEAWKRALPINTVQ